MILVLPATNRRKNPSFRIYSASPTTFLEWICPQLAYVSRSTSRHFPDFVRFGHSGAQKNRILENARIGKPTARFDRIWPGKLKSGLKT